MKKVISAIAVFGVGLQLGIANEVSGTISASESKILVGQVPTINWNAEVKEVDIDDLVDQDDDVVEAKKKLRADVRVIGAGWGNSVRFDYVQIYGRVNSWEQIYLGTHVPGSSSIIAKSFVIEEGETFDLAARGYNSNITNSVLTSLGAGWWGNWRISYNQPEELVVLRNGSPAPQVTPSYSIQKKVEDYLSPYIDTDSKTISIGSRDLIYLFDFNGASSSGWDLQDAVVVVTFTEID